MLSKVVAAAFPGALVYVAAIDIDWSNTINLGALVIAGVVGLAGLAVLGYGARWKAAATAERVVSDTYRGGQEAFKARADRLEMQLAETQARNEELAHLIGEQKKVIARLESLPNLERIIHLMGETAVRQDGAAANRLDRGLTRVGEMFDERIAEHDRRAAARAGAQLEALTGIAKTLHELADRLAA